MLQYMGRIGAVAQSLKKTASLADAAAMFDHRGQPGYQAVGEPGQRIRWRILQVSQIDPSLKNGMTRPDVGTAERQDLADFHNFAPVRAAIFISVRSTSSS